MIDKDIYKRIFLSTKSPSAFLFLMSLFGSILVGSYIGKIYFSGLDVESKKVITEIIGRKMLNNNGVFSKAPPTYVVYVDVEGKSVRHKVDLEFYKSFKTGDRVTIIYDLVSNGRIFLKDVYRDSSLER